MKNNYYNTKTHCVQNTSDAVRAVRPSLHSIIQNIASQINVELPAQITEIPDSQLGVDSPVGSAPTRPGPNADPNVFFMALLRSKSLIMVPSETPGVRSPTFIVENCPLTFDNDAPDDLLRSFLVGLGTRHVFLFGFKEIWQPLVNRLGARGLPWNYTDVALLAKLLGYDMDLRTTGAVFQSITRIAQEILPSPKEEGDVPLPMETTFDLASLLPSLATVLTTMAIKRWKSLLPLEIENRFCSELVRMEAAGIPIDRASLEKVREEQSRVFDDMRSVLDAAGIDPYGEKSKQKAMDAGKGTQFAAFHKAQSYLNFLNPVLESGGDRIYSHFTQFSCESGRMAAGRPNVLGIPKTLKKTFYSPAPGRSILSVDLPSSQLRVLAAMTKEPRLIEQLRSGVDVYSTVASEILGKPIAEIGAESMERSLGKALVLGAIYGMTEDGFSLELFERSRGKYSREDARRYYAGFFQLYAQVAQLKSDTETLLEQGATTAYSLGGRAITLRERTHALNYPVTASESEIVKSIAAKLGAEFRDRGLDAQLINIVHDNFIVEAANEDRSDVERVLKEVVEEVLNLTLRDFTTHVTVELLACREKEPCSPEQELSVANLADNN